MSLRIGIVASALSADPRHASKATRELGFDGILFDAVSSSFDITSLSQTGRREFRHVLSSSHIELIGLRADLGAKGISPGADVEREIKRLERAMEAAKALGAAMVCSDVGPLPEPARAAVTKPKVTQEQAGLIIIPTTQVSEPAEPEVKADTAYESHVDAVLREVGKAADRFGVILAMRSELSSFAALHRALRAADCPWFGVDLDPAAVLADRWGVEEVFVAVGPLIRHVRGRDAQKGHDRRTRPAVVGKGDVDWAQVRGLLDEAGYNGWVSVDPVELADRAGAARMALAKLRG